MAKSAKERKRDQRERERKAKESHETLVLSRRIKLDLYHKTDQLIISAVQRAGLHEEQDLFTRFIHATENMTDQELKKLIDVF